MSRSLPLLLLLALPLLLPLSGCAWRAGYDTDVDPPEGCLPLEEAGSRYAFCAIKTTWEDGRTLCETAAWHLVTIDDETENSWVADTGVSLGLGEWWIGLHDHAVEGLFVWTDGSAVAYTKWDDGEPNNSGDEDCAHQPWGGATTWNDKPCSFELASVCEL